MKSDDKINNLREELMQEIKDIKKDVGDIKLDIATLPEKLVEKFDIKYANKDIEKKVTDLSIEIKNIDEWKTRMVAIISTIMFILTFLKDPLLKLIGLE